MTKFEAKTPGGFDDIISKISSKHIRTVNRTENRPSRDETARANKRWHAEEKQKNYKRHCLDLPVLEKAYRRLGRLAQKAMRSDAKKRS